MTRRFTINSFSGYVLAFFFAITITACGGGTDNIEYGSNTQTNTGGGTGTGGGGTAPLPQGTQSVLLSWVAPQFYSDGSNLNLQGHKIYMKTGNGDFSLIYTMNTTGSLTYTVDNLVAGATYTFAVTAFDAEGVESVFSNTVQITI